MPRHLYRLHGSTYFDSMALEEGGNICVATLGEAGISVVSLESALLIDSYVGRARAA